VPYVDVGMVVVIGLSVAYHQSMNSCDVQGWSTFWARSIETQPHVHCADCCQLRPWLLLVFVYNAFSKVLLVMLLVWTPQAELQDAARALACPYQRNKTLLVKTRLRGQIAVKQVVELCCDLAPHMLSWRYW